MSKEVKVYKDSMGDCWYYVNGKYYPVAQKEPDRNFATYALFGILAHCRDELLQENMEECFPNGIESTYVTSFFFEGN